MEKQLRIFLNLLLISVCMKDKERRSVRWFWSQMSAHGSRAQALEICLLSVRVQEAAVGSRAIARVLL